MKFETSDEYQAIEILDSEPKTGRFITLSVFAHAALAISMFFVSAPPLDFSKKEIVEIEVAQDDGVVQSQGEAPAELPVAAETQAPAAAQAVAAAAEPVTATAVQPVAPEEVAEAVAPPPPPPVAKAKVAPVAPPKAVAKAAVPETLDDIKTQDLETSDTGEVAVAPLEDKDLQDDFEKVDQAHAKALAATKAKLEKETADAAKESDDALAEADKETQAEAQAMAKANEERRQNDAKKIAALAAAEKSAAEKAAADRAAAAREAASQRKADEAAAAAAASAEALRAKNATGEGGAGEGTGSTGSPEATKEVAGIPGGVRSLEQLRQKPGNKFPQYAPQERLARQEGQAIFYAYVNKDGSLSQFRLGQSTGFRNLDGKTLAALKAWKFYPGQEGWVEMPFQWSLKGDALEAGGQLRK